MTGRDGVRCGWLAPDDLAKPGGQGLGIAQLPGLLDGLHEGLLQSILSQVLVVKQRHREPPPGTFETLDHGQDRGRVAATKPLDELFKPLHRGITCVHCL